MRSSIISSIIFVGLLSAMVTPSYATNGYIGHGYGIKSRGMAGAGVALPQETLIAATNPAGMAFLGDRLDISAAIFSPRRSYQVEGVPTGPFPLANDKVDSTREYFVLPEMGVNWQLDEHKSFGLVLFGNGGMNTQYPASETSSGGTFGAGSTGVDLAQIFLSPTFSYKFDNDAAIGVSAILAYQRFSITGVSSFAGLSTSPTKLSNNGHDHGFGAGVNLGFMLPVGETVTLGGGYRSRVYMERFDSYEGLFAEQGSFDIPASGTIGLAWKTTEAVTLLLDVQKTWYSSIDAIGNAMMPALNQCFMGDSSSCLGGDNGIGFGWKDMTTVKFGVQWDAGNDWIWRSGFSHGNQPIPDSEVFLNIVAPGVIEDHFTVGFTKKFDQGQQEINFGAMFAPKHSVKGYIPSGQTVELEMTQYQLELGWSKLF